MGLSATAKEQQARIADLNKAMKEHYGETGEDDNDHGEYHVDPEGHDATPARRSSPPPGTDRNGSYLFATAAQTQFRGSTPDPSHQSRPGDVGEEMYQGTRNRRPFVAPDYPSGPSPEPYQIEAGDYGLHPGSGFLSFFQRASSARSFRSYCYLRPTVRACDRFFH